MIVLIFSPIILALSAAMSSKGRGSGGTFLVIAAVGILVLLLISYVMYICLLHRAKTMLLHAKAEDWDPLAGVSDEFCSGNFESNPW